MTQEILFDCVTCDRRFECALRDVPNYCPKRDGETTSKKHARPILDWDKPR